MRSSATLAVALIAALALAALPLMTASNYIVGVGISALIFTVASAALNLVYLPLYAAGTVGPAIGAVVASLSGIHGLFVVGGCVFLAGALTIVARGRLASERQPVGTDPVGTGSTPAP